jgi:hypothetical protein
MRRKSTLFGGTVIVVFSVLNRLAVCEDLPKISDSGFTPAAVCGQCHEAIYNKWKDSMHSLSIADPIFDLAFMQSIKLKGENAKRMCLRCHAPVTQFNGDYGLRDSITKEGITCDFCHSISGVEVDSKTDPYKLSPGKRKWGPLRKASSPAHEVEESEWFRRSEFCGACHEFTGKGGVVVMGTYSEWKQGPYAKEGKTCQDCHMPMTDEPIIRKGAGLKETPNKVNLHDLQGGHSLEQLSKALKVRIASVDRVKSGVKVKVILTNVGSGHMIPTGIPSRKLVLRLIVRDAFNQIVMQDEKLFKKVLSDESGAVLESDAELLLNSAMVVSDNRIAPKEAREVEFSFSYPEKKRINIEVKAYYSYEHMVVGHQEMSVEMASDRRTVQ